MKEIRFYFHDLICEDDTKSIQDFINLFDALKSETDSDEAPSYIDLEDSKIHIQILKKEVDEGTYFFGKLLQSHNSTDFKKESKGILIDFEFDEETGICQPQRGVIYFLAYFNPEKDRKLLMVEDVPFALNIGGLVTYLKEKLELTDNNLKSKQRLGRNIIPILNATGDSEVTLAKIRFKKNVTDSELGKVVVEDAIKKLKEENLDCELIIRWGRKDKISLKEFIKKLFKIPSLEALSDVDYGTFLRTLTFQIDNESHPKINMKDDIIKYVNSEGKEHFLEHENDLYTVIKTDFDSKYTQGKLND